MPHLVVRVSGAAGVPPASQPYSYGLIPPLIFFRTYLIEPRVELEREGQMAINKLNSITTPSSIQNTSDVQKSEPTNAQPDIKLGVGSAKDAFELASAQNALAQLQNQLVKVDVQIKNLMNQIENAKGNEQEEQDRIKAAEEQQQNVQLNLEKATKALQDMLDSLKLGS
jgi:chromosome segregation ATPase